MRWLAIRPARLEYVGEGPAACKAPWPPRGTRARSRVRVHRFAGFVFVCAFTLINLYVGVIFSQFSRIRLMSTTGSAFLTNEQHEWAELAKMVFK